MKQLVLNRLCYSGRMSDVATAGGLGVGRLGLGSTRLGHGDRSLQSDRRDLVPSMRRTNVERKRRKLLRLFALYAQEYLYSPQMLDRTKTYTKSTGLNSKSVMIA